MARRRKTRPKPRKTKRLMLRRLYRRGRVYVPVVALVVLTMAFCLPISPPGLPGYVSRTIAKRLGVPVSIERIRLRLITGEVTLTGIRITDNPSATPFEVGEVYLTGDVGELIAGNGRWPAAVVVDNASELEVAHRDGSINLQGALDTLVRTLRNAKPEKSEDEEEKDPSDPSERPTPSLTIRNTHAVLRSDDRRLDGTRVALQQIHVPQRIGSGEPLRANFSGVATAGLSEPFSGTAVYSPRDKRGSLQLSLEGIKRDVTIGGFGNVRMAARDLQMEVSAHEIEPGAWQIVLDQDFGRFEIAEMRTGGERWIEEDLSVRARGIWDRGGQSVRSASLSVGGSEIDLSLDGMVHLDKDRDGEARLRIRRFPAPLIALGQRLARDEGFTVWREDNARLNVDVSITGPFARIGQTDVDGSVQVAGWAFQRTGWPERIVLHDARGDITNSMLEVSNLRFSSGTLDASGNLKLPVLVPEGETRPGELELSLRGTPETAFDFLRAHGITKTVVTAATVPLAINVRSDFRMGRQADLLEPMLETESLRVRGDVTWGEGAVLVEAMAGTIDVQPGGLVFDDSSATIDSLAVSREDVAVRVSGRMDLPEPHVFKSPAYNMDIGIDGSISQIVSMIGEHASLPPELETVDGSITLSGNVHGVVEQGLWPTYDVKANIANGRGTVTFQVNPAHFSNVRAELHATNERVAINRLETDLEQDTHGVITGEVTREGAAATFRLESSLETVTYVLPRELDDMVMAGKARADGTIRLEVNRPLPEAPDVATAWIAALTNPAEYKVHVTEDAALRLRIAADLTTLEPVTLFHREFPQRVDNIRGIIRADELGFIIESIPSRWGDAEDVIISGRVTLGHVGPVNISFEAIAPDLDLNDWLDGWGSREWAEPPPLPPSTRRRPPQTGGPPPPRLATAIHGRLRLGKTEFLSVRAEDVVGELTYEAWQRAENKLQVNVEEATTYGGSLKSTATVLFPQGSLPRIRAMVVANEVGVNGFLADLRQSEEQTVGKFTGRATLEGELVDYSTWVGSGEYTITESKFIGDQVLIVLSRTLRLGFEQTQADTTWRGTGTFRDEVVTLPDMVISNNEFNLLANGTIGFNGDLDFRIAVEFLGNRMEWIPLVRRFAPLVNRFTDFLVSVKLEGTVYEPRTRIVPLTIDMGPDGNSGDEP
jgi:hypothetical protein